MQFFITFLEGFISFISPCMLPMLPIYVGYFTAADVDLQSADAQPDAAQPGSVKKKPAGVLPAAIAFVLGFTTVFTALGLFAGTLGHLLSEYRTAVNIVGGVIVILFGLSYLGVIPLNFLRGMKNVRRVKGVVSAYLFGLVYSVSLTPCVGAFLGSALALASASGTAGLGTLLLLTYSLGLGAPFVISAVLIDRLRGAFDFIKRHYRVINIVCGVFLIVVGLLMAFGLLNLLLSIFS